MIAAVVACGGGPEGAAEGRGRGPGRGPNSPPGRDAVVVSVDPVQREPISALYSTSATLRADNRASVIARTRGVIERLLVEEGDTVEVGQPLARLEDEEQRIAAERARTTYAARLREYDRLAEISDQGLVSEDELERARQEAEDAKHVVDLAELTLERTVIRAPFSGVVVTRFLDQGATVSDGTAVYEIADLNPLYADVSVPERHVTRLRPGQTVRVTADASDETVDAAIQRIAPSVDPETGTVKVTVEVPNRATLRPGAFVRVDIVTATHEDTLVVPRSALVAEGRRWQLYRLNADRDTVEQIEVDLGFETGDRVEIASVVGEGTTLEEGDPVVTAGAPALSEGAAVEVIEEAGVAVEPEVEAASAEPTPTAPTRRPRRG